MLYQKSTVNDVQTVYNTSLTSTTWKMLPREKITQVGTPPNGLVFDLPNTMTLVSAVAGPSQMTACTAEFDA